MILSFIIKYATIFSILYLFISWGKTDVTYKIIFFIILAIWLWSQYHGAKLASGRQGAYLNSRRLGITDTIQLLAEIVLIIMTLFTIF